MSEIEHHQEADNPVLLPEIRWSDIDPRCGILYYKGFVGNWGLFRIRPVLGNTLGFYVSTLLPGMKGIVTSADSLEQAKQTAVRMLERWLGMLYRDDSAVRSPLAGEAHRTTDASAVLQLVESPRAV